MVHTLTRDAARRLAVQAQLLSAERPAGIVETIDALASVNIEPTAAIAPSADLILWSRLGWPYQSADLLRLEVEDRAVFEWNGFYRTMADLALMRLVMNQSPRYAQPREWLTANAGFRADVLARLRDDGPLRAAEIPDTAQVSWRSTGWTNNRNSMQMLEILVLCGDVAIASRDAGGRLFDLAERVYPADVEELSFEEAALERAARRLGAQGIARAKSLIESGDPVEVSVLGEEAVVEGVPGVWRIDPEMLAASEDFAPRTALLSPFDRLVFDRARLEELFGFEYILEMYKPPAKRRWGYFALPILHGDRFVGKLDAKADRKAGVLRINALHEDEPFTAGVASAVDAEVNDLARWLGLEIVHTRDEGAH